MGTIADVAARAGVSIATVSRVLSPGARPHPVNQETAHRVREAAEHLDFVPSALARGLASRRSGFLALLVPDLADPHYPPVAQGVEDRARSSSDAVFVCNTLGDPVRLAEYLRLLRARRVDCLVVSGGGALSERELDLVRAAGVPCVLIGRPALDQEVSFVAVDNVAAGAAATRHLVESGRGRIVHLAGPRAHTTMADRATGYADTLAGQGIEADVVPTDGSPEDGYRQVRELLRRTAGKRPDAVFAATDRLAISAIAAVHDADLTVPGDVAIVGFDDLPVAGFLRPSLTSVAQPARRLGEEAVQLALDLLAGAPARSVLLEATLVVRASSAAARTE